jgi:putative DNA primase/helicase
VADALLNPQAFPNAAETAEHGSDARRAERAVAGPILVPGDLAERYQWVLWRYETRDGKPTKVPYQINGRRASSTDSATWVGFQQAKECLSRSNEYDGIGFVFSSMDPYCGLDLDDCMTCTGDIKAWAQPILAAFGDTYMEISPSGKGVKIFARASLSGDGKRVYVDALGKPTPKDKSDGAIEIYDRGRYFTVTGDLLNGAPLQIEDHQADVNALYALIFGASSEKPKANCFTSSMTGNAPVPVPITSRQHFQGISSSTDSGVCPKVSRNFLDGFFLRLRICPASITTSCS